MRTTLPSGTPAILATPADGTAPTMGLVVSPDIHGIRPLFDEACQHLADRHGWAVCCPEPWPGRTDLDVEAKLAQVGTLVDDEVVGDLLAAADATGAERVGVIGFCMGGMYATKAAATGRFARAASYYGMIRLPEHWRGPAQSEPIDALASAAACPLLGIYGTVDPWTPPADVDAIEAAGATVVRYEGADHGFVHDASRPAHRPDDAADAWQRVVRWLEA